MVSLKKPDSVEKTLAEAPLPQLVKSVASLFAVGLSDSQVAEALGELESKIKLIRELEPCQDLVLKVQLALGQSSEQRIANAVNMAIDVKIRALSDSTNKRDQLATSTEILDRHMGKPVQTVASIAMTIKGSKSIKEVDSKFDALMQRLQHLEDKKRLLLAAPSEKKVIDLAVLDV